MSQLENDFITRQHLVGATRKSTLKDLVYVDIVFDIYCTRIQGFLPPRADRHVGEIIIITVGSRAAAKNKVFHHRLSDRAPKAKSLEAKPLLRGRRYRLAFSGVDLAKLETAL